MKKHTKYFILGGVVIGVSVLLMALFLTLPAAIKDAGDVLRWVCVGGIVAAFLLFLFGWYLVKKGNFWKNNAQREELRKETEEELSAILERKYKELEEYKKAKGIGENDDNQQSVD